MSRDHILFVYGMDDHRNREFCHNIGHGLGLFYSLEMSCPPKEFLDESFLAAAKVALVDEGMLVINVVSRAARAVSSAASKLQKVNNIRHHMTKRPFVGE